MANAHNEVWESLWCSHFWSHRSSGTWLDHCANASGQDQRKATPSLVAPTPRGPEIPVCECKMKNEKTFEMEKADNMAPYQHD